jgi:hypothetical protein
MTRRKREITGPANELDFPLPLLAPLSVWRWPLSVDTCPPVMTYKANTGQTRRFLRRSESGAASHCVDHAPRCAPMTAIAAVQT